MSIPCRCCAMLFVVSLSSQSLAVAAAPAVADSSPTTADALMGEIVVTARKREEKSQDVPISISAFSGASLEAQGVERIDGIANLIPNMTYENNPSFGGSSSSAAIYIRGIGQKEFLPTVEPGVGTYVDGVYIGSSVGALLDLVDIDQVDVLRGPQGTLFGRNTIGGAVDITTRKPSATTEASAEVTAGSLDRIDTKVMASGALADDVFVRIDVAKLYREGYVNRPDEPALGNVNTLTTRIDLRWVPSTDLELNWSVDGTRDHTHGPAVSLGGINLSSTIFDPKNLPLLPPGSAPKPGYYVPNPPFDAPTDNFSLLSNYLAYFLGGQPCLQANPYSPQGSGAACYNTGYVAGHYFNYGTGPSYSNNNLWGTSVAVDWKLGPVELKSITAFRSLDGHFARDGDDSPLSIVEFYDDLTQNQLSQEFQLLGQNGAQTLKYVTGLYFYKQSGNDANILNFTPVYFLSGGHFTTDSYAAFGQVTWTVVPNVDVTAGLRYTEDRKAFLPDQYIITDRTPGEQLIANSPNTPKDLILPDETVHLNEDAATPLANLAWHLTDDVMTYATYSKGFKSGGFDQRVFPPLPATPEFGPEKATSYELGFKSQWFDHHFTVNGAVFYTDYTNLQVQVFNGVAPVTENAAAANIKGAELETRLALGEGWFLQGSAGYLDPKYTKVDSDAAGITTSSQFERVSKWTVDESLVKSLALGNGGEVTGRIDWSYRTGFFMDALDTQQIHQPGYALTNASLAYEFPGKHWTLTAGITNIFDKQYTETGIYDTSFGQYEQVWAPPRAWYASVKWKL